MPALEPLLQILYPNRDCSTLAARLKEIALSSIQSGLPGGAKPLQASDTVLITYADQLTSPGETPLSTLGNFLQSRVAGIVSTVHLLPFYPSSSDDGFSVMDYYAIDPAFGEWRHVSAFQPAFDLMFDAVFNHASVQGEWFRAFLQQKPDWETAFYTVEGSPDLSAVVRPRTHPLLTRFATTDGLRSVWTTFSADQADLNFQDPRILEEIFRVFFFYIRQGARFIRLDAIAYLWKQQGTSCIHLPQTHAFVRLLRVAVDLWAPGTQLITETNVPHSDNISYFGSGNDEAHLVYNFALPPLVLHTLGVGNAEKLTAWAEDLHLPSPSCTFFNFLASHDGIGLNPARGILSESEILQLQERVENHGGFLSWKSNSDGSESVYEMNISYFDALSDPKSGEPESLAIGRFLAAHCIMLSLQGLPAVYFHSLFGSRSDREGAEVSGIKRRINREKLSRIALEAELDDPLHRRARVFQGIRHLLEVRGACPALAPSATQEVFHLSPYVFALRRRHAEQELVAVVNVTSFPQSLFLPAPKWFAGSEWSPQLLLGGSRFVESNASLSLPAYGAAWLAAQPAN